LNEGIFYFVKAKNAGDALASTSIFNAEKGEKSLSKIK